MSEPDAVRMSLEERRAMLERFNTKFDKAQLESPPSKSWVGKALRRQGAPRCPVRIKELTYEVVLRYGDALADLFAAYPDDFIVAEAYDLSTGYPRGAESPIDSVRVLTEDAEWTDEWGIRWGHSSHGVAATPIAPALPNLADLDDYLARRIPDPALPDRLERALPTVRLHGERAFLMGTTELALFERLHSVHGMENSLEDLYASPRETERLLDALTDYYLGIIRAWASIPNVDAIWITDDWGSQTAMLISPEMWRRSFRPRYRRMCDEAHMRGLMLAFHSCGNILPIIGDLIDIGVDILNPLQPDALDLRLVAREFGGEVTFWGGISDQAISTSTPAQVRDEVRRAIDLLGAPYRNAYIVGLANTMMPEVPFENIVALFEACHDQ